MAKKASSYDNMAQGLFSQQPTQAPLKQPTTKTQKATPKKTGRPRDADLKEGEKTIPTTIQLTEETLYKIDKYCLEYKKKSRSEVVRLLIQKHLNV